jgi:2-methylcitrate dehydratase PrpD
MGNIMGELVKFTLETKYENLPAPIVNTTKNLLLDSIGCALAGLTTDPGKMAIKIARTMGGPPDCSVIGTGDKVSIISAVLANGQLTNALDFDSVGMSGHTPPYIIPTELAMSEKVGSSGKDLILASALGFEIAARLASATPAPMQFVGKDKAFKYAKREGYAKVNFGAAAGAGRLLGLDAGQMANALAVAGHMSQLLTWSRSNYAMPRNLSKYGFPGWQNTGAIIAVLWAQMGFQGDVNLLDDPEHGYGEFSGYDNWTPEKITAGLGNSWNFADTNFKHYACCASLHRCLDVFYQLQQQYHFSPEEIENITCTTSPTVDSLLFTDRNLNNIVDLQFGLHYALAMAAYGEKTGVDWQDWNKLTDPKILEFSKKITLKGDPEYGQTHLSKVTVVARGGQSFKAELSGFAPKLTDHQLIEKFRHNASRNLTQKKIDQAVSIFSSLEKTPKVSELISAITL